MKLLSLSNSISKNIFKDETLRVKKKEREDLGVDLYGVQQELARYQVSQDFSISYILSGANLEQNFQECENI